MKKMYMQKRILSLLLSIALVLTLIPTTVAKGAAATSVTLTNTDGSQQIITEDSSASNWSYEKETSTLTLKGWSGQMISTNGDLNLKLEGTNTITMVNDSIQTYGINANGNKLYVSGSSATDELVINADLTSRAYAIKANIYARDYANININFSSTYGNGSCYGIYGTLYLCGSNSVINVDVTSAFSPYAVDNLYALSRDNCGSGNVIAANAKCTANAVTVAMAGLYVSGTNPVITATATNSGGAVGTRFAVLSVTGLDFSKGGKLTANGLVGYIYTSNLPKGFDGGKLTSTEPANNAYIWSYRYYNNSARNFICNADGTDCLNSVFVCGDTDVALQKVPGSTFELPEGKVGEQLMKAGKYYSLTDVVRGIKGYLDNNIKFEIVSGTLPDGISLNRYYGTFYGTCASECAAGKVTVRITNVSTEEAIEFDVNYGKVVEADKYITINGNTFEMKTNKSGTGWTYDGSTKTVTLENYIGGPITAEAAFNLHIKEGNTITIPDNDNAYGLSAYSSANSTSYDINITAQSALSSLSISSPNRTKSFRGINCKNLYLHDNVSLYMTVSTTSTSVCYGCYGSLYYSGSNINLQMGLESKGQLCGVYTLDAKSSVGTGSDCIGKIDVKSTSSEQTKAVDILYVNNAAPKLELKSVCTGDSTKSIAIAILNELVLVAGGRLETTGLIGRSNTSVFKYINRNVVTTTPAGDKYIWEHKTLNNTEKYVICTPDGEICNHTIFEYSAQKAQLQWLGDSVCKVPSGLKGGTINSYNYGLSYDIRRYIRGLDDYNGDSTKFEIIEGSLPQGLSLNSYGGYISGVYSEPCLEGSVKVRATNKQTNESIEFNVKYGNVLSAAPVTALALSGDTITVGKDGTTTFTASVTPANAAYPKVVAVSSNSNVVEVLQVGTPANGTSTITLKGRREGTATVTVTSVDSGLKKNIQVTVTKKTPSATIDYADEKLRNVVSGESYLISVGEAAAQEFVVDSTSSIAIKEEWMGKTIKIVHKGATIAENSPSQSLAIPARSSAPTGASETKAHNKNSATGKLTFTASSEYRKQGTAVWIKAVDNVATNLSAGIYEYRKCATTTAFASEFATVAVTYAGVAIESCSELDITNAKLNESISTIYVYNYVTGGDENYVYSIVSGPAWLTIDATGGFLGGTPNAIAPATIAVIKVVDSELSQATVTINICAIACENHSYTTTTTPATLEADGKIVKKCSECEIGTTTKIYKPSIFALSETTYEYDGNEKTPTVIVKDSAGNTLVKDKDYKVTYSDGRKEAGDYTATITFMENYSGIKVLKYSIYSVGCAKHSYATTTSPATLEADGKIVQTCSACGDVITSPIYRPDTFEISETSYVFDGIVKTPTVTVKDTTGKTLLKDTDYTVSISGESKDVGNYTVTINFTGQYSGTKNLDFTIVPKGTSISKIKAKKGGFKVTLKKQAKQTTGYQLQYSNSLKFTSAKTITISKNTTLSKSINKLAKNKKYYVRVRTYKKVGNTNYYSSWSSVKNVKTKK